MESNEIIMLQKQAIFENLTFLQVLNHTLVLINEHHNLEVDAILSVFSSQ